jgi:hypothetical protein
MDSRSPAVLPRKASFRRAHGHGPRGRRLGSAEQTPAIGEYRDRGQRRARVPYRVFRGLSVTIQQPGWAYVPLGVTPCGTVGWGPTRKGSLVVAGHEGVNRGMRRTSDIARFDWTGRAGQACRYGGSPPIVTKGPVGNLWKTRSEAGRAPLFLADFSAL